MEWKLEASLGYYTGRLCTYLPGKKQKQQQQNQKTKQTKKQKQTIINSITECF
jgi:signal recognition particle GTPase